MGDIDLGHGQRRRKTWALSGTLVVGDPSRSVNLQTGDLSDGDFKTYSVSFGVTPPALPMADAGYQATATITFSVNGVPFTRIVSVGQGVSISGPADSVTVRVVDDTPVPNFAPAGGVYTVSILVVPGTRAATEENMPLLYPTDSPLSLTQNGGANFIHTFDVPVGAGVVGYWLSTDGTSANPPKLDVQQLSGATLFEYTFTSLLPVFTPLAPGSNQVQITNEDTSHAVDVFFMWVIDG